ncbi:MAG: Gfo/Idh/MocA family oxidoreductase [Victivallaceae bacterium]
MNKSFKLAVLGAGSFARNFIPLFQAHPLVEKVGLAELFPERRKEIAERFGIADVFENVDQLCDSDYDAVAIFTQRWMHGPQAIQIMKAGKDVYSSVPGGISIEEMQKLIETVEETGRMYMLGETTRYHPSNIFCRQKFANNEFGDFVYAEAEYLHDMEHGFKEAYQFSGGEQWAKTASFPPMFYPTHSVGNVLSAVGGFMKSVSCLGFKDTVDDGIFDKKISMWNNNISNQTALFQMSNGGMARTNEFRRVGFRCAPGKECVRLKVFGTKATFEQNATIDNWICKGDMPQNHNTIVHDITEMLDTRCRALRERTLEGGEQDDFFATASKVHPIERLPRSFAKLDNGHSGSHQFLVDDFCRAVVTRKLPFTNVWFAGRVSAAGITAHESALKNGERLPVPNFGYNPGDIPFLDYSEISY